MEEEPKRATDPHSDETSRLSSSSKASQKHEAPQPTGGSASATADLAAGQQSKRRRGLGVVTPNACTECRKKRAKVRLCLYPITYLAIWLRPPPSSCSSYPR